MLISIKARHAATASGKPDVLRTRRSVQRFGYDPDAEDGPLRLVEQLHVPLGILLELACDACRHVGAGVGQRLPRSIAIGALGPEFGRA